MKNIILNNIMKVLNNINNPDYIIEKEVKK